VSTGRITFSLGLAPKSGYSRGMRALFTGLMISVFLVLHYLDSPHLFVSGAHSASEFWHRNFQEKEVRLEGLKWLSRTEIERVLPLERSVVWWMLNTPAIQSRVAESPWIGEVAVDRCGEGVFSEWGCFVISVKERAPRFLAVVDEEAWVISSDGTFVVPASRAVEESSEDRYRGLVTIEGLASRQQSPDLVRSQVALASSMIETIEKAAKLRAKGLSFEGRGDVAVSFERLSFPVVFSASRDASVSLEEQGERFSKLLAQLHGKLRDVEKIDLAFSQVGVVKFKGPQ
jgi:hypothetical protein